MIKDKDMEYILKNFFTPFVVDYIKYMVEEDKKTMCKFRKLLRENKKIWGGKK